MGNPQALFRDRSYFVDMTKEEKIPGISRNFVELTKDLRSLIVPFSQRSGNVTPMPFFPAEE
jgi:hypothetical protein